MFTPLFAISQTTSIPDVNFEQALINYGYDTGTPDGSVLTANISSITCLTAWPANCNTLSSLSISDLTGIEDFTALTTLDISYNSITNIDLSNNINLRHLYCDGNQLTSLDLSNNIQLRSLYCGSNSLSSLDLTSNSNLDNLYCSYNQLTSLELCPNTGCYDTLWCEYNLLSSLDLSQNICFTHLICSNNLLTCLNVQNGSNDTVAGWNNQTYLIATSNPSLTCIQVDNAAWSTSNWSSYIDPQTSFSTNCNYPASCFSSTAHIKESTKNISLFPNPTNDQITVNIEDYNGSVDIDIYDLSGRLLQNTNSTTISLKNYAKGIYIFRVSYGDIVEELRVIKD